MHTGDGTPRKALQLMKMGIMTQTGQSDYIFFGLVSGFEVELGYFSLKELEEARGPRGLPIERDLYFQPKTLKELKELHERGQVG